MTLYNTIIPDNAIDVSVEVVYVDFDENDNFTIIEGENVSNVNFDLYTKYIRVLYTINENNRSIVKSILTPI